MTYKFSQLVIKLRWPIIVLFFAIAAFFALQMPKAVIDPEVKNMLPDDLPERLDLNRIEELFGGTDMIMLVFSAEDVLASDSLKRLKQLSNKMGRIKQVDRVLSLFTLKDIRSAEGTLVVDPAVKRIPKTDKARERLREELKNNEVVFGNVVSKNFKTTAIIGMLDNKTQDDEIVASLQKLIEEVPGPEQVDIAGMPYLRHNLSHNVAADLGRLMPAGLLVMLLFLFICFRQLRGVLLPFTVVIFAIIFGMGLIPLLGWKIQTITILLPVILIAVANDYGIHVLARFQEENIPGNQHSVGELAGSVVNHLLHPVVATGLTTMVGMLCLLSHIIVPAQQLGILCASAVGFALLGSLVFIPAWLAILPKPKPVAQANNGQERARLIERILYRMAHLVAARPKTLLLVSTVLAIVATSGMKFLLVDTDPMADFKPDSQIRKVSKLVDESFGGSASLSVVAKGNIKDPQMLKRIDELEKKLAKLPEVGQTSSIAKIVRQMNRVLQENDPDNDRIPDTLEAVAQYFLLYSMSGEPEDFDRIVDFSYENALLTARLNTFSATAINRVLDFAEAETNKAPQGTFPVVGGFVSVLGRLAEAIVSGQIDSLLLSLLLVGLVVMLVFRSIVAGLFAMFPLGVALALLFGLMGYFDIPLNVVTAMLSSIMIGVGVDYTIHYLWRHREESRAGKDPAEAVRITLKTTGRGIVFNGLSVIIGFLILFISYFNSLQFFGFLVVVSIAACLFGSLCLLPALCLVLKPRFLEGRS
jgi:predicted RND superfamily exporter protein